MSSCLNCLKTSSSWPSKPKRTNISSPLAAISSLCSLRKITSPFRRSSTCWGIWKILMLILKMADYIWTLVGAKSLDSPKSNWEHPTKCRNRNYHLTYTSPTFLSCPPSLLPSKTKTKSMMIMTTKWGTLRRKSLHGDNKWSSLPKNSKTKSISSLKKEMAFGREDTSENKAMKKDPMATESLSMILEPD